jgi:DNA-binding transcriptional LysR family regulator
VDVRQLATFRTIVETGNFARAAGRLGIGASTVTLHIQQLEAELGGPLFVRQGRRLDLTELGSSLRRHADAIAGHLDAIGEEAAELGAAARGTLRAGAVEPVAHLDVAPLLARVARGRTGIRVRLDVGGTALVSAGVAEGRLAFAVCSAPPPELDVLFEPLFREPVGVLAPAGHELARLAGDAVVADALGAHPVVAGEPGCAYRARVLDAFTGIGVDLDLRAEVGSTAAVVEAVRAGMGIALVALAGVRPAPAGTVALPVTGIDLGLDIGLVRPRTGEPFSALTSRVIGAIRADAPTWRRGHDAAAPADAAEPA